MDLLYAVADVARNSTPAQYCQAFFLVSASIIATIQVLPEEARSALMEYGARRQKDASSVKDEASKVGTVKNFLDTLTSYGQVPHSWFLHFYIVSVSLSVFWAWQYISQGSVMRFLATLQVRSEAPSTELGQVFVAWLMMALQGTRRLYESLFVINSGTSPMWAVHWLIGLVYYITMSVAVWVEASATILESWESPHPTRLLTPRVLSALALYVVACAKQNECHQYLASLKKYTLPDNGWFRYLVCPHYTFECLVYLSIAWVAAPQGRVLNASVLCGLLFVATNLGATAAGTKKWYSDKFGNEKVAGRWKLIPLVF